MTQGEVGENFFRGGGVSHCELSAVIILLHHLRQGMPHPSAHASVAHGNYRILCECNRACVLCTTLGVMRHTHACELWLWSCGVVVASAFN